MLVNAHLLKLVLVLSILLLATNAEAQTWSLKQCIDTAIAQNKTLKIIS